MPNHTMVEVRIESQSKEVIDRILAATVNAQGDIDFELLLPIPLNCWRGSVGTEHKKLPDNALDWCSKNWGTKWGPYGNPEAIQIGNILTLRFQTAWAPPRGWLLAIWNKFRVPFEYYFLDEYDGKTYIGIFQNEDEWSEKPHPEALERLSIYKYGEEAREEIKKERQSEAL